MRSLQSVATDTSPKCNSIGHSSPLGVTGEFKNARSVRVESSKKECLVGIRHAFVDVSQHVKCVVAKQAFLAGSGEIDLDQRRRVI